MGTGLAGPWKPPGGGRGAEGLGMPRRPEAAGAQIRAFWKPLTRAETFR
jgi:hypothetical protein